MRNLQRLNVPVKVVIPQLPIKHTKQSIDGDNAAVLEWEFRSNVFELFLI